MNKFEATSTFAHRSTEAIRREEAHEMKALANAAMQHDRVRAKVAELASRKQKRKGKAEEKLFYIY